MHHRPTGKEVHSTNGHTKGMASLIPSETQPAATHMDTCSVSADEPLPAKQNVIALSSRFMYVMLHRCRKCCMFCSADSTSRRKLTVSGRCKCVRSNDEFHDSLDYGSRHQIADEACGNRVTNQPDVDNEWSCTNVARMSPAHSPAHAFRPSKMKHLLTC